MNTSKYPIAAILLLGFAAQTCSDNANPHRVFVRKISDNFGGTTTLSYDASNRLTLIEKTANGRTMSTTLTHQGDSTILDDGAQVFVVKFAGNLPAKQYSYLKTKPGSHNFITTFHHANGVPVSSTFVDGDSAQPDSMVTTYTWTGGNLTQYHYKNYKNGSVTDEHTLNNTFDTGNNFSNGDYLFSWVLGFEGSLFAMSKNNLVGTSHSGNSLNLCCYQFQYNSNGYPTTIKALQSDTYTLEYKEPN